MAIDLEIKQRPPIKPRSTEALLNEFESCGWRVVPLDFTHIYGPPEQEIGPPEEQK